MGTFSSDSKRLPPEEKASTVSTSVTILPSHDGSNHNSDSDEKLSHNDPNYGKLHPLASIFVIASVLIYTYTMKNTNMDFWNIVGFGKALKQPPLAVEGIESALASAELSFGVLPLNMFWSGGGMINLFRTAKKLYEKTKTCLIHVTDCCCRACRRKQEISSPLLLPEEALSTAGDHAPPATTTQSLEYQNAHLRSDARYYSGRSLLSSLLVVGLSGFAAASLAFRIFDPNMGLSVGESEFDFEKSKNWNYYLLFNGVFVGGFLMNYQSLIWMRSQMRYKYEIVSRLSWLQLIFIGVIVAANAFGFFAMTYGSIFQLSFSIDTLWSLTGACGVASAFLNASLLSMNLAQMFYQANCRLEAVKGYDVSQNSRKCFYFFTWLRCLFKFKNEKEIFSPQEEQNAPTLVTSKSGSKPEVESCSWVLFSFLMATLGSTQNANTVFKSMCALTKVDLVPSQEGGWLSLGGVAALIWICRIGLIRSAVARVPAVVGTFFGHTRWGDRISSGARNIEAGKASLGDCCKPRNTIVL